MPHNDCVAFSPRRHGTPWLLCAGGLWMDRYHVSPSACATHVNCQPLPPPSPQSPRIWVIGGAVSGTGNASSVSPVTNPRDAAVSQRRAKHCRSRTRGPSVAWQSERLVAVKGDGHRRCPAEGTVPGHDVPPPLPSQPRFCITNVGSGALTNTQHTNNITSTVSRTYHRPSCP